MTRISAIFLLCVAAWAQEPGHVTFFSGTQNTGKYLITFGAGRKPVAMSDFNIFIDGQHFVLARAKHYFVTAKLPPGKHIIVARTGKKADDKENARLEVELKPGEHKFVLAQMFFSGFWTIQKRSIEMQETTCQQAQGIGGKYKPLAAKHIRNRNVVEGSFYFPACPQNSNAGQ